MSAPPPPAPFDRPWHAQAFALAVALNEAGHFPWTLWAERFGATLSKARATGPLDGSDDYYRAWVATLEGILSETDPKAARALADWKAAWTEAYLSTPHGQPVKPVPPGAAPS